MKLNKKLKQQLYIKTNFPNHKIYQAKERVRILDRISFISVFRGSKRFDVRQSLMSDSMKRLV